MILTMALEVHLLRAHEVVALRELVVLLDGREVDGAHAVGLRLEVFEPLPVIVVRRPLHVEALHLPLELRLAAVADLFLQVQERQGLLAGGERSVPRGLGDLVAAAPQIA